MVMKIGVIGLGVGEKHIEAYQSHPKCDVVALCDFDEKKLVDLMPKTSMIRTFNAKDILEDPEIDLVSIASYDNYHHEQVMSALQNEKHVFVEKPLCFHESRAVEIKKMLHGNPHLKLSSNFPLRTDSRFMLVRDKLRNGELGEVFYLEADYLWGRAYKLTEGWRKELKFYSIVYGAAIHMIDLILWITGKRPVRVWGVGNKFGAPDFNFNNFAIIVLTFDDGMIAKITANGAYVGAHSHMLNIFGIKGNFITEYKGYQFQRDDRKVITSFVDYILDSMIVTDGDIQEPIVPTQDVFDAMSVCFAAERAIQEGKEQVVEYI